MTQKFHDQYKAKMDSLCKPTGSLGVLEKAYVTMASAWGAGYPAKIKARHIVYASNNGFTREDNPKKVAAYPREVTAIQFANMKDNGAVINQFCTANGVDLQVMDVGIDPGTKDFSEEPAMSAEEFSKAWRAGAHSVGDAVKAGYNLLSFGELGIGNTTTSAAVLFALCNQVYPKIGNSRLGYHFASLITGYGANATEENRNRKVEYVIDGYNKHGDLMKSEGTLGILRCVGGFDMVAMTSAMMHCGSLGMPFVLDGFISNVCYACAYTASKRLGLTQLYAIPSHLSAEQGAIEALKITGISPKDVPIHAGLCLGEGTGAILMVSMLRTMKMTADNCKTLQEIMER